MPKSVRVQGVYPGPGTVSALGIMREGVLESFLE